MYSFKTAIKNLGLTLREVQNDYATAVDESLLKAKRINLLQADTGVGKSLGYSIPAVNYIAEHPGSRVIITSNTIALLRQLDEKDLPLAEEAISTISGKFISHSLLLGRKNFISSARLELAIAAQPNSFQEENESLIAALSKWSLSIDEFINQYGDLPNGLEADNICQTTYAIDEDQEQIRANALNAQIIVTSHAMLINDMLSSGALFFSDKNEGRKTILIVDEADLFNTMLHERQQTRVNLLDLRSQLRDVANSRTINLIDKKINEIRDMKTTQSFVSNQTINEECKQFFVQLKKSMSKGHQSPELREMIGKIDTLLFGRGMDDIGVGVSSVLMEPAIVFINPFLSRLFGWYATKFMQSTILTSGTLSNHRDINKGVQWLISDFKITPERLGLIKEFSPDVFGTMNIVLAGPKWPAVFKHSDEVQFNDEWIELVSSYVKKLAPLGNVLLLTNSHLETKLLVDMLKGINLFSHLRGQKLSEITKAFINNDGGVLVTAGGGVGLDLRNKNGGQLLDHVVKTRIPFSPRNEVKEREMASYIDQVSLNIGRDSLSMVRSIQFKNNLNTTIRLLKQHSGRGIRNPNDVFTFHILDPRFPLAKDLSSTFAALRNAIPTRFLTNYEKAVILMDDKKSEEILVW